MLFPLHCIIQLLVNSRKPQRESVMRVVRAADVRLTFLTETCNTLCLNSKTFEGSPLEITDEELRST